MITGELGLFASTESSNRRRRTMAPGRSLNGVIRVIIAHEQSWLEKKVACGAYLIIHQGATTDKQGDLLSRAIASDWRQSPIAPAPETGAACLNAAIGVFTWQSHPSDQGHDTQTQSP